MQPSRRSVLVGGALGLAAACRRKAAPAPNPDVALKAAALQREQELLAAYESVMAARPALAPHLAPLAGDKAVHVAALGTSSAASSAVRSVAQLRALESSAAAAHTAGALQASRDLAPLLASLAASSSSAAAAL